MNANLSLPRLRPEDLVRIADNVPQLVWVSDSADKVRWCNRTFGEYRCQSAEDLNGMSWLDIVHPDDREAVDERWHQTQQHQDRFEAEARLGRYDGAYRRFLLRAESPSEGESGEESSGSQDPPDWIVTGTDIEELRSLQHDYDSILRSIPDVISRVGRDRKITSISPNVESQNGWTLGSFVGKMPDEAPLWDNQAAYHRLLEGVFETGIEADFEYEHRDRFYRARLWPETDARGEIESVLSITEDITDLRRNEATTLHQSELFEGLSNATPGMIYLFDIRERRVIYVSGGVVGVLGYSPAQMQTLDMSGIAGIIHPDDYPRLLNERCHLVDSSGEVLEIEHRIRHADGSWRWLHARDVLFSRDANGAPRQILGVAIDVTARREAEMALRLSEERLRRMIDAVQLGTWEWFIQEGRILWNEWHWRLFGLEPQDKERRYEDFERHVHPDDRQMVADRLNAALEMTDSFHAEFRVLWPDGSQHWISGHGNVTELDEDGQPVLMNGILTDVTARKAAETALQRAHDELEKRVAQRTAQLQSTVSQLNAEVEQRREAQAAHRHLLSRLVNMQEEERRRLSRELHDQFGQTLTAMLMTIDAGGEATGAQATRIQNRLRGMVEELMDQMHQRAWELRPASLDNLGLVVALRQLTGEWPGGAVDFVTRGFGDTRLTPPLEIAFYRVVQEALTNVARHANATQISVVLEKNETDVVAIVEDNGGGFDLERAGEERLGLLGMRERMDAIGGTLEIETEPEHGTSVFARAPLVSPRNSAEGTR